MLLEELLKKRLVFVSGKGGVGKSLVSSALARAAQRRGKRVLLIEIDSPLDAARHLRPTPKSGDVVEVEPGLSVVNLDPDSVMDEYVRVTVRVQLLWRRILDSPVYRRFFTAAPGLKELITLGKVMLLEEAKDRWSRRPRYDLIVVDAPATGHGLSLLKVPAAASAAIPVGPVGHHARRILGLLRDARKTCLVTVAIPEEMAVVEAAQFTRSATDEVGVAAAAVVLNQCHEPRFSADQERDVLRLSAEAGGGRLARGVLLRSALLAARRHLRRVKLTRFYKARLRRALELPLVCLPYLYDEAGPEAARRLADRIEAA